MEEYILYLDESRDFKDTVFVIGGFIIKKCDIEDLENYILTVKKCICDNDYILEHNPILHCTDLNTIKNNRTKNLKNIIKANNSGFLNILINKDPDVIKNIYDNVYIKLCEAVKKLNIITLGCILNVEQCKILYGDYFNKQYELFFDVAMQQIIENYSYFLHRNKSVGSIVYESRNGQTESLNSSDSKMFNNFCKIKVCNKGISFMSSKTVSQTIKYFNSYSKYDDVAGLQLADFIAYEFMNRGYDLNDTNYPEFTKKIFSQLYNGGYSLKNKDLRYYFGLKNLPFNYDLLISQQNQIGILKKANKNLKNEKNKLLKANQNLKEHKRKLIEDNNKLQNELKELKFKKNTKVEK